MKKFWKRRRRKKMWIINKKKPYIINYKWLSLLILLFICRSHVQCVQCYVFKPIHQNSNRKLWYLSRLTNNTTEICLTGKFSLFISKKFSLQITILLFLGVKKWLCVIFIIFYYFQIRNLPTAYSTFKHFFAQPKNINLDFQMLTLFIVTIFQSKTFKFF